MNLDRPLKPYEYQKTVIRKLAKMPVAILAAEMGTGKTLMSLVAMEANRLDSVLVACPAVAVSHWIREHKRLGLKTPIHVVSFDKARQPKTLQELRLGHQGVIIDEAHYLKSPDTKRTKAIYGNRCDGEGGLVEGCKRVYALSGTICPNNVSELYPHLRLMVPDEISSFSAFTQHFCSGYQTDWGFRVTGARNVEQLKGILRKVFIALRARDVLPDLPAISFNVSPVDPLDARDALLELKEIETLPEVEAMVASLEEAAQVKEVAVSEHIATLRRLIGAAKTPAAAQYILDIVEGSQEKVVVFCYHKFVIQQLFHLLAKKTKVVRIDGSTSPKQRDQALDQFRRTSDYRVFIGQIHACGTGITLTESNHVVFVEQDWTPAANLQASKRCHRIGQDKPVFVHNLMLNNSIDERISAALSAKSQHLLEIGL